MWFLIVILTIAGLILGAASGDISGVVALGLAGFVLGLVIKHGSRVKRLEKEVKSLRDHLADLTTAARVELPLNEFPETVATARLTETQPMGRDLPREESLGYAAADAGAQPEPLSESAEFSFEEEPPSARPVPPPLPSASASRLDDFMDKARGFLTTANIVLGSGIIILFFGVSFLLKYAVEHNLLPLELRYIGAGLLGIVLMAIGWRLRYKKRSYALLVQGAAVGVLYITVFFRSQMARPGAAFTGLCPDGGPGALFRPLVRAGRRSGPGHVRGRGRLFGAGPDLHRRRPPRHAFQLLCPAQRRNTGGGLL